MVADFMDYRPSPEGAPTSPWLRPTAAIGIMTYGSADFMGVPWETIIKMFVRKLGDRLYDHVEQYAEEFLRFIIEISNTLFPESVQRRWPKTNIREYWQGLLAEPLAKKIRRDSKPAQNLNGVLDELIKEELERFSKDRPIEGLGAEHGNKVVADYSAVIDEVESEVFNADLVGRTKLSSNVRRGLHLLVSEMYAKTWSAPYESGIVVAGMGESEPFPAVVSYQVGAVIAGKLRSFKIGQDSINDDYDAAVIPFAQTQMIDMFYEGMFPDIKHRIIELAEKAVAAAAPSKKSAATAKKIVEEFSKTLSAEIQENYTDSLISAVGALPRYDLASLAEALVNITAFRARMSASERETVGGAIDVAVISKGDGFCWVKRKNLVRGVLLDAATMPPCPA